MNTDTSIGELFPVQTDVPRCFVCGSENPSGLKLRFKKESQTSISTQFTAPPDWTGWGSILHGGFQSLLLDEITGWVAYGLLNEKLFVTGEMTVRFLKPVYVEKPLRVVGQLVEEKGRAIIARGEIRDSDDNLLTESLCTLIRLKPENRTLLNIP